MREAYLREYRNKAIEKDRRTVQGRKRGIAWQRQ